MSIKMMLAAFEAETGSPTTKLVLLKLADNANDQGECWPSHEYIARLCEMSVKTSQRHINKLETLGFVTKTFRRSKTGNKSNFYKLNLSEVANSANDDAKATNSLLGENSIETDCRLGESSVGTNCPLGDNSQASNSRLPSVNESLGGSVNMSPGGSDNLTPDPVSLDPVSNEPVKEPKTITTAEMFDKFWSKYPVKREKAQTRSAFLKLKPSVELFELIMTSLEAQTVWRKTAPQGKFIPAWKHAQRWIKNRNWEDVLEPHYQTDAPKSFAVKRDPKVQDFIDRYHPEKKLAEGVE
ncbi:helix-turn-helix domain-containing protein [Alteromonadaceae bacterium M269]|nr:helix-turn-helix domain-containing protein [Alteromonadaceae bacterium M269]